MRVLIIFAFLKIIQNIARYLLKANFFIALAVTMLLYTMQLIISGEPNFQDIELTFFSTLLIYNLLRLIPYFLDKSHKSDKDKWLYDNKNSLLGIIIISIGFLTPLIWGMDLYKFVFLAHVGFLSLIYSLPFTQNRFRNLRAIPFLKIFIISYVWSMVIVGLPSLNQHMDWNEFLLNFTNVFLFILAITLPFDIRDFRIDFKDGLKTIPGTIGINATKVLAIATLLGSSLISCILFMSYIHIMLEAILVISGVLLIYKSDKNFSDWYYLFLIDGLIILKAIIILIPLQL